MFHQKGKRRGLTFIPVYKTPMTECRKIAFTPCTAVKMSKVYIKPVIVGYDSAPEEGPATNCDCFVKQLPSLRRIKVRESAVVCVFLFKGNIDRSLKNGSHVHLQGILAFPTNSFPLRIALLCS